MSGRSTDLRRKPAVDGSGSPPDARGAILTATERLLADVQLHRLSVAQIIKAANISRATFYFYFDSKFAVVAALIEQVIDEIFDVSRQTPIGRTSKLPPEVALEQRIRASAAVWRAHRP